MKLGFDFEYCTACSDWNMVCKESVTMRINDTIKGPHTFMKYEIQFPPPVRLDPKILSTHIASE